MNNKSCTYSCIPLYPGERAQTEDRYQFSDLPLNEEDFNNIMEDSKRIILAGQISYEDIFGDQSVVNYGYYWRPGIEPHKGYWPCINGLNYIQYQHK
jgi:hypothetical protein